MTKIPITPPPEPVNRLTREHDHRPTTQRRGEEQSGNNAPQQQKQQTSRETDGHPVARDPAVSIAATTAHFELGQQLEGQISKIDIEGRPVLETAQASIALRPDAGLKPGDKVQLVISDAGRELKADLIEKNQSTVHPPISLQLTVTTLHNNPDPITGTNGSTNHTATSEQTPYTRPNLEQSTATTHTATKSAIKESREDQRPQAQDPHIKSSRNTEPAIQLGQTYDVAINQAAASDALTVQLGSKQYQLPPDIAHQLSKELISTNDQLTVRVESLSPTVTVSVVAMNSAPTTTPSNAHPVITLIPAQAVQDAVAGGLNIPPSLNEQLHQATKLAQQQAAQFTEATLLGQASEDLQASTVTSAGEDVKTTQNAATLKIEPQQTTDTDIKDIQATPSAGSGTGTPSVTTPETPAQSTLVSNIVGALSSVLTAESVEPGNIILAFQKDGQPVTLSLLGAQSEGSKAAAADLNLPQPPSHQFHTINSFTPVSANALQAMPYVLQSLAATGVPLAEIILPSGPLVLSQTTASALIGQKVELSQEPDTEQAKQAQDQTAPLTAPNFTTAQAPSSTANPLFDATKPMEEQIFNAQIKTGAHNAESVTIMLSPSTDNGGEKINSVQSGPVTNSASTPVREYVLGIAQGEIRVTLPDTFAPLAGMAVNIVGSSTDVANSALLNPVAQNQIAQAIASGLGSLPPLEASGAGDNWPSFEAAASAMDPSSQAALLSRTASGGSRLANSMLFLLTALGRGSAETWLGADVKKGLSGPQSPLFERLKSDAGKLLRGTNTAQASAGAWQSMSIPFDFQDNDLSFLLFLSRREHDHPHDQDPDRNDGDEQDSESVERFLIEVNFSSFGPLQLDGRIFGKRFDLSLYVENGFSDALTHELQSLFRNALEANGFHGGLSVENNAPPKETQEILAFHR